MAPISLHPLVAGFDGVAEHYERGRPGYPDAAAREIAEALARLREEAGHPLAVGYRSETRTLEWTPPGFEGHPGFAPVQRREDVRFVHHTDRERLVAQAASISFVGILEPARRAAVLADVPYRASVWLTRRLA